MTILVSIFNVTTVFCNNENVNRTFRGCSFSRITDIMSVFLQCIYVKTTQLNFTLVDTSECNVACLVWTVINKLLKKLSKNNTATSSNCIKVRYYKSLFARRYNLQGTIFFFFVKYDLFIARKLFRVRRIDRSRVTA